MTGHSKFQANAYSRVLAIVFAMICTSDTAFACLLLEVSSLSANWRPVVTYATCDPASSHKFIWTSETGRKYEKTLKPGGIGLSPISFTLGIPPGQKGTLELARIGSANTVIDRKVVRIAGRVAVSNRLLSASSPPSISTAVDVPTQGASRVTFVPTGRFLTIKGTDLHNGTTGRVGTAFSPGFGISMGHSWPKHFSSSLSFNYAHVSANQAELNTIANSSVSVTRFGLGLDWRFLGGINTTLGLRVSHGQELFYRSTTIDTYQLETIATPSAGAALGISLYENRRFGADLESEVGWIAPISQIPYSTKSGIYWKVSPVFNLKHRHWPIRAGLSYSERIQKSEIVQFKQQEAAVFLGLSFTFGGT